MNFNPSDGNAEIPEDGSHRNVQNATRSCGFKRHHSSEKPLATKISKFKLCNQVMMKKWKTLLSLRQFIQRLFMMSYNRGADPRARRMGAGSPADIRRAQSGQV